MSLSFIQKTWVAGMSSVLSLLLLVFKMVYPLPLAILLVFLCASVALYVIWKKTKFLFVIPNDEFRGQIHTENDQVVEKNELFRNNTIKEIDEDDDINSSSKIDKYEAEHQYEENGIDGVQNHELFIRLEEVENHNDLETVLVNSSFEEDSNSAYEEGKYPEKLIELEEIDFSARMESTYEEEELNSFFDDFKSEVEQEELETARAKVSLTQEVDNHANSDDEEYSSQNWGERISQLVDRETTVRLEEIEESSQDVREEDIIKLYESIQVEEPIILEEELDQMLENNVDKSKLRK